MKFFKLHLLFLLAAMFFSCGIGKQTQQLKAFEDCSFKFVQLDSLKIAGSDITPALNGESINLNQLSGIALGFLTKEIPLDGLFTIQVENMGSKVAALNKFDYEIFVEDKPFTQGVFAQAIRIEPGDKQHIKIPLQAEIYQFLRQEGMLNHLQSFLSGIQRGPEKKLKIQFKIKPSIKVGTEWVKYPGFLSLEKTISNLDIK